MAYKTGQSYHYVSLMGQMEPAIFPGDQFKLKIDWSHENIGKYQK